MSKRVQKGNSGIHKVVTDASVVPPSLAALRASRGEYVPQLGRQPLPYADYTNYPKDLASALTIVKQAQETFMDLPAKVRQRFMNDPGVLSEFVANASTDSEVFNEGVKLGIFLPREKNDKTSKNENNAVKKDTPTKPPLTEEKS